MCVRVNRKLDYSVYFTYRSLVLGDLKRKSYLAKSCHCLFFNDKHIGQSLEHGFLQVEERFIWNLKARHQHNHLPVQVQHTCSNINTWYHWKLALHAHFYHVQKADTCQTSQRYNMHAQCCTNIKPNAQNI